MPGNGGRANSPWQETKLGADGQRVVSFTVRIVIRKSGEAVMTAVSRSSAASLPVRPGEELWTDEELGEVRAELADEAAGLRAEIDQAESQIAQRLGDTVSEAGDDEADASSKLYEREQELALTHNTRELLEQTEHALARIDAGTYGVCESCGKPIGKARLLAFPRATLCVECKQRQERR
jgi:DnaK suppressor protein